MFYSKKYKSSLEQITKPSYEFAEGLELLKKISTENFDSSIQLSFNLNVDPRHADQQIRGSLVLPNGSGKISKVLAIVKDEDKASASKANYVGGLEQLEKIKKENWFDFDFIVTTPDLMSEFAKYGKILGPKGLMPNPKLGTVTTNLEQAIDDIIKGQIEYRTDKEGNINVIIGKKSFENKDIIENFNILYQTLISKRPASVKGDYIKSITISTAMSPGIKITRIK